MRPLLPGLTGLRFVAAFYVVVYHALRPALVDAQSPAARLLANGPAAVTLFFVLSGFVLTWAYEREGAPISRRAFLGARIARLVPVYLVALVLVVPLGVMARARGLVHDPLGPSSLLLVVMGLQAWVPDAALRWNPPAWSLSCEVFFYALFPWLFAAMRRASRATLLGIACVAWAVGTIGPGVYMVLDPDGIGVPRITDEATWLHVIKFNPVVRVPEFILGMVAGRMFVTGGRVPGRWAGACAIVAVALVAMVPVPTLVWHNAALAPLFAIVIAAIAGGDSVFSRMLASSWMTRLGEASYALYVLHVPLMMWAMALVHVRALPPGAALIAGAVAIPVSLAVETHIERPARMWVRRRLSAE